MSTARKQIFVLSLLVLTVAVGFALRTTMNVDAAQTAEGTFLLSGNDPYYHKHAVDHIVEHWETLEFDNMLNFPIGSTNPNPPLYEWSVAVGSQVMEPFVGGSGAEATDTAAWWSILYAPAIWGTLTIIPAYLIGREFAGPWGGLLAGFLVATSPEHMSRSSLGFSDHDAINLFFIAFGFYFLIRSIKQIGTNPHFTRAQDLLGSYLDWFKTERRAAGAAVAAGTFFGALALTWKGFPYVFGVVLAYSGLQFLFNHWRQRDNARILFATFTTLSVAALLSFPHYFSFGLMHFWQPSLFLLAALVAAGVFFVATQRYPAVLVLPGLLVLGAIFGVFMFLVFPDISAALLNRFVYFQENRLYQTIAEARPASFSNLSFTVGPIPFFLYVVGVFWLGYRVWDTKDAAQLLFFSWVAVDLFMGISAVRFLSLIVPSMAILAAATTVWLIEAMELPSLVEGYKRAGGGWRGIRRSTGFLHIMVILFVGMLVLAPNAFLAVDAAVPSGYEQDKISEARESALADVKEVAQDRGISGQNLSQVLQVVNQSRNADQFSSRLDDTGLQLGLADSTVDALVGAGEDEFKTIGFYSTRFGAFGQSFLPNGWRNALTHLNTLDQEEEPAERPGFLAWWDYGHWSIAVANHPAVADNFQNGYTMAGTFLVSQSETEAIQLMGARMTQAMDEEPAVQSLRDHGIDEFNATRLIDAFDHSEFPGIPFAEDPEANRTESVAWLNDLEEHLDKEIRYVAADNRMLPIDNPSTRRVESGSIFYAPVTLAGEDPDRFVETVTVDMQTGRELSEKEVRQLQRSQQQQAQIGQQLKYKTPFFNSMYYRAFVGLPAREPISQGGQTFPIPFRVSQYQQFYQGGEQMLISRSDSVNGLALTQETAPGFGLRHFRLIHANNAVRLLQYYPGAIVEGTVEVGGEPMENARVTVFDDAGDEVIETNPGYFEQQNRTARDMDVPHDSTVTGPNGTFRLVAPFSQDRGTTIRVTENRASRQGPIVLANETLSISIEEAENRREFTVDLSIQPANLTGVAFHDVDQDGERDPTEELVDNATITVQGRNVTTGPDGRYSFEGLAPGQSSVTVTSDDFQLPRRQGQLRLEPGQTLEKDLALELEPISVNGTVTNPSGSPVEGIQTVFTPTDPNGTARQANTRSQVNGSLSIDLQPGTYELGGNGTVDGRTLEVSDVRVVGGTGASVDDQGRLTIDRDAEGVELRVLTEQA